MTLGTFIVIEGSDGSGKSTQFKKIKERLENEGRTVVTYDFPQYTSDSSYFVREYLSGTYGSAEALGAYTPSLFYALDRFSASAKIREDLAAGKVVLCDRFVGSNMAHQGQKFTNETERDAYFQWLYVLEFDMLKIPKPDLSIVLIVPAEKAKQLIDHRGEHSHNKKDIHEADLGLLERSVTVYRELCVQFPNEFTAIECTKDNDMLSIDAITDLIAHKIEPLLQKNA